MLFLLGCNDYFSSLVIRGEGQRGVPNSEFCKTYAVIGFGCLFMNELVCFLRGATISAKACLVARVA